MEIKEIIKEDVEFMQDKLNSMLKELNKNKTKTPRHKEKPMHHTLI